MKVAIMTDVEGVAGVINSADWIHTDSKYYEQAKVLLTEEVNAAIKGLYDAGATETVVIDAHGPGAINTVLLDKRALYSRGWDVTYQFGLNDGFDAIIWVGQHAKAGTILSHLTHTGTFYVLEERINGMSVGEYAINAFVAGMYGVPAVFVAGERALKEEVMEITPWVHFVEVKHGVTRDNGAKCDAESYAKHNWGAIHVHPEVARQRIYEGAKAALEDFIKNPDKFKPVCPKPPYTFEIWTRKRKEYPAEKIVKRHDTNLLKALNGEYEIYAEGTYELPYEYKKLD